MGTLKIAFQLSIMLRGLQIAALVGTILVLINQGDRLFHGPYDAQLWIKLVLTYLTPYCVSVVSSVLSFRNWQSTQELLLNQKRSFERFPESNPNPVFRVSAQNELIYANSAAQKMFAPMGIQIAHGLPQSLVEILSTSIEATAKQGELPTFASGVKRFEVGAAILGQDRAINAYCRDVTAEFVIQRLPERNPAPVLRMTDMGELRYANPAAQAIVTALELSLNAPIPSAMYGALVDGAEDPDFAYEIEANGQTFAFSSEWVPELELFNLYGTDISAIKALTRFPAMNPNPVFRVNDSNVLIYANPASALIFDVLKLGEGDVLPPEFIQSVIDSVHASQAHEPLPRVPVGIKIFELSASRLAEKGWINVYARDVTAEDVIRRLPERNPAVVLRVSEMGELLYGNPASKALLQFLNVKAGDTLPSHIYGGIVDSADAPGEKGLEVETDQAVISLTAVWVPEFSIFNVYGTDITAMKALTRFPAMNPNPVLRLAQKTGELLFANSAAQLICQGLHIDSGQALSQEKLAEVEQAAANASAVEVHVEGRIFELQPVAIAGFDFFNLYGTEVTAARQLAVLNAENEALLLNILPPTIAVRLRDGEAQIADFFEDISVLFADIVGFTNMSAQISPHELLNILNTVFSVFDELTERYQLEKIKTIGDAYMVVGGLDQRSDHAHRIALMGLDMVRMIRELTRDWEYPLDIRVGIHVGTAVAGVIGIKKFIYDVWGDTVNVASRMESNSLSGKIQLSEAAKNKLEDDFFVSYRGLIDVKGKGELPTWFLDGARPSD